MLLVAELLAHQQSILAVLVIAFADVDLLEACLRVQRNGCSIAAAHLKYGGLTAMRHRDFDQMVYKLQSIALPAVVRVYCYI